MKLRDPQLNEVMEASIRSEVFGLDRMVDYAHYLAEHLQVDPKLRAIQPLITRNRDNADRILESYKILIQGVREREFTAPGAEWFIDNFHIIEEQIREIKKDLPRSYYEELPRLSTGELYGYPRIYALSLALVAHTDSNLSVDLVRDFIEAFQEKSYLSVGELWALPITLRLTLVENIRRLVLRIIWDRNQRAQADLISDRIIEGASSSEKLAEVLKDFPQMREETLEAQYSLISQIVKRLREQEVDVWPAIEYLEKQLQSLGVNSEEIVQLEHRQQAANQVTVANIITSMRLLSTVNWKNFFEQVSLLDRCLAKESTGTYWDLDFTTRDIFRKKIERIARKTGRPELEVAESALELTLTQNVFLGEYLHGEQVPVFERHCDYQPSFWDRVRRIVLKYPTTIYLVSMIAVTFAIFLLPLFHLLNRGTPGFGIFLISLIVLVPISDMSVSIANFFFSDFLKPRMLGKYELKQGVPVSARTLVAIPCMLIDEDSVQELTEKLEVHYLANTGENIFYALLSDFVDSHIETKPEDEYLLTLALQKISQLNKKYQSEELDLFYIFHRRRLWNPDEGKWIGWERKRGKIEELNQYLRGSRDTTFMNPTMPYGLAASIQFVITLDADTKLGVGTARRLIGTALYPVNSSYGIIQPRVGVSIESSSASTFAMINSNDIGLDPYSSFVSDVYQDLFGEGNFAGKALYRVDMFRSSTEGRFPENRILSHDLIEGAFAGVGFASDIEIIDDYPKTYNSFITRQHRWVRGDWQIASWMLPWVPSASGYVKNSLRQINRWKIYDNLRRSLVAACYLLSFFIGWVFLKGSHWEWTLFTIFLVALPPVIQMLRGVMRTTSSGWLNNFWAEFGKLRVHWFQFAFSLIFLGHRAIVEVDAAARAIYRVSVSKKNCLEWVPSAMADKGVVSTRQKALWQRPQSVVLLCMFILAAIVLARNPMGLLVASPFLIVWSLYNFVGDWTSKRIRKKVPALKEGDRQYFLDKAQRIWLFFETFVTRGDNWLPPDNVQEDPAPAVAHRTSPTNIGLYLLSTVAAKDLGFISQGQVLTRLSNTFSTIRQMEHFEGHLLNWYDTTTLEPLHPRYISLVDSGNYAAYLLTLQEALCDFHKKPYVDTSFSEATSVLIESLIVDLEEVGGYGIQSTVSISNHLKHNLSECLSIVHKGSPLSIYEWSRRLEELKKTVADIQDSVKALEVERGVKYYHSARRKADALDRRVMGVFEDLQPFFEPLMELERVDLGDHPLNQRWRESIQVLVKARTLDELHQEIEILEELFETAEPSNSYFEEVKEKINLLKDRCLLRLQQIQSVQNESCELLEAINFRFLLDKDREVFVIGYNISEGRFDNSFYDLLASEARTASFISIALRQVSPKHWFRLGRKLVPVEGGRALVSWSASMFEYLMPQLVMQSFENTLIDETLEAVVRRQISYGNKLKIPWGVSEAGYNARDVNFNYQYGPFGIPGLGLKRGLGHDLVVSPYSTFLAAQILPLGALKNLKRLESLGVLTDYGFYESLDFTAERLAENQSFAVVRSYMAHHQGMSLIAIDNILNQNIMQARFHRDLRVRATQSLLQEKIPPRMHLEVPKAAKIEWRGAGDALSRAFYRTYKEASHYTPRVQILSNGRYSVMISTAGSGLSQVDQLAINRWREDSTRDIHGSYVFIRDLKTHKSWSATYNPCLREPEDYRVVFAEDKVDFWRENDQLRSHLEVIVTPDDTAELRRVTLTNDSFSEREIEITSYLEPVLSRLADDQAHPAFSNLFLQTEFVPSKDLLIVRRRPRLSEGKERWGFHGVVSDAERIEEIEYETDRAKFLGRGRSLHNPVALEGRERLSNSTGSMLDPVLSLRVKIRIPAQSSRQVIFATGFSRSREELFQICDRINDLQAFERESKIAWTKARIDLRHLDLDSEAAYLFQRLAEKIIFSDSSLRQPSHLLAKNTRQQASLWPYGISGDLPIVVLKISDRRDVGVVRRLLKGHEYLRLKGLVFDLVMLTETESTYMQDLFEELNLQIRYAGFQGLLNKTGGIYLLKMDSLPEKDRQLIQAMARVVLSTERGTLREQVTRKVNREKYLSNPPIHSENRQYRTDKIQTPKLQFFNEYGGFSEDGEEYVIHLKEHQWTPAPWINVVANSKDFGFQVSESGSGFTWSVNSRENRLTPWSNDSVSDTPGECFYIRDEVSGEFWSPTPLPIRGTESYLIRHGQGYSIFEHISHGVSHELCLQVSLEDPVKLVRLRLKNLGSKARQLSIFSYVEWVLGNSRDKSAPYILTEVDAETTTILAKNSYNHEFAGRVSFCHLSRAEGRFTCDRKEFIGRNGSYHSPEGLKRRGLSAAKGIAFDPCAVLQTEVLLEPGEETEVLFLLGQAENTPDCLALVKKYSMKEVFQKNFESVRDFWSHKLGTIQVKTPEPAFDFMINKWLLYQSLVCRMWARSAFYQSGGAYGFRDQLQDSMAFVYSAPEIAREHILRASSRQFPEGDVQHWWHPPTGRGVRTHFSDDLLWLPLVVSHYIRVTGDATVLDEVTSFIEAPLLAADQEDSYTQPQESNQRATVREHCQRAIRRSLRLGVHGLPLIGSGDWNDGMNRIGEHGKGESVWMAWFLYKVIHDFSDFVDNADFRQEILEHSKRLQQNIHKNAWDGNWYRRAYFDDGTPVGSALSEECQIDSVSQTWSVLSGAGEKEFLQTAMKHLEAELIDRENGLIKLLKPPFDKITHDPGYIKGYVPGVRENGGQYTHAAIWVVMAFAEMGEQEKAFELFQLINPVLHSQTLSSALRYKVEPYVVAADVYAIDPHVGRGGWSWYTGSASWFYRAGLESILGFQLEEDLLKIKPCVPKKWDKFFIKYIYGKTTYEITVYPQRQTEKERVIKLIDDGKVHKVEI